VIALAAAVLALVVGVLLAQPPGGMGGGGGGGGQAPQAGPGAYGGRAGGAEREQQRMNDMLAQAGLSEAERIAAEGAVGAKLAARRELTTALTELRNTAEDQKATEAKLKQAIAAYEKALAKYRGQVEAQDRAMVAKLSVRGHARCLALGILDNGVGMSFRRGGGGGGGGGFQRPAPPAP
jgi:hypothetical protein